MSVDLVCFRESGTEKKIQEETEKKIDKFLKSLGFRDFDNVHPDGSKVRMIIREIYPVKNRRIKKLKQARDDNLWVCFKSNKISLTG